MLTIEYFQNFYFDQGAAYSEGFSFTSIEQAADNINDTAPEKYLETLHRKKDGTVEIIDLSRIADELVEYDREEFASSRSHARSLQHAGA